MLRSVLWQECKRFSPLLWFWALYTTLFLLWVKTFFYTLPLLLGALAGYAVQPLLPRLEKSLRLSRSQAAGISVAALFLLLSVVMGAAGICAGRELALLLQSVSEEGTAPFLRPAAELIEAVADRFTRFDLRLSEQSMQELLQVLQNGAAVLTGLIETVLGALSSLPTVLLMVLVTMLSAFCFVRDLDRIKAFIRSLLRESALSKFRKMISGAGGMGRRYLLSYLFLYSITFCETCIIFAVLGLAYPVTAAAIAAIADVIPVLGPGTVFLPVAVYQLLLGKYGRAAGLLIGWAVITVIRQIVEPKIVASTVRVSPLAVLTAVYFSLVGRSLWILLYVLGLCVLCSALRRSEILPTLTENDPP